jgi:ABC-2 type transport system permease protein
MDAVMCFIRVAVLSGGLIFISLNLITCIPAFDHGFSSVIHRFLAACLPSIPGHLPKYHPHLPDIHHSLRSGILLSASYILGRETHCTGQAGAVFAIGLFLAAYRIWLFGLRHYSSTGS